MKHIKTFEESIYGDVSRKLNPKRKENDAKAEEILSDILDDYDKYPNLKKVKIMNEKGNTISFPQVRIGKEYKLHYIFGKYHPSYRDHHVGNREAFDRRVEINAIPFTINIKKKYKFEDRVKLNKTTIKEIVILPNHGEGPHRNNVREKSYTISADIANKVFNYFLDKYNEEYPELKDAEYKGSMTIRDVERGLKPTLRYGHTLDKNGHSVTFAIRDGDDVDAIKKMIKGMTKDEYDSYSKREDAEERKPWEEKEKVRKNKVIKDYIKKMYYICDKYSLVPEIDKYRYKSAPDDKFEIIDQGTESLTINFRSVQPEDEVKEIVHKMEKEFKEFSDIKSRVSRSYSYEKDKLLFITIYLENYN